MGPAGLFIICSAIWGSTWLAIKYQLGVVAPELSVAYRFALASLALFAWCALTRRSLRFPLREHRFLIALGVMMMGLNYIGIYWSEQLLTSGLVAVLFSTIVFMSPFGMRLAFGTPVLARTLMAAALGVGGVALLFLPELDQATRGGSAGYGVVLALGSTAIACGGNLVAIRNHRAGIPTFPGTAWAMAYGSLIAAIVACVRGVPWRFDPSVPYLLSLTYLALFGSVIAFGAYLTLLKRVGGEPASFVGVATPVIALALSTAFEGYRWTWIAGVGVVLAMAGNWLALRSGRASGKQRAIESIDRGA